MLPSCDITNIVVLPRILLYSVCVFGACAYVHACVRMCMQDCTHACIPVTDAIHQNDILNSMFDTI